MAVQFANRLLQTCLL